jgi:hypothetical protein
MSHLDEAARRSLLRRGFALEYATLTWNVIGNRHARSGGDPRQISGPGRVWLGLADRDRRLTQRFALRLIGAGFAALAVYLLVQSTVALVIGFHSPALTPGLRLDNDHRGGDVRVRGRQGPNRCRPG